MTLSDLVASATIQGSVSVCQANEKGPLDWDRCSHYETIDLSCCDISWAREMEVKCIYAMRGTLYVEVAPKD